MTHCIKEGVPMFKRLFLIITLLVLSTSVFADRIKILDNDKEAFMARMDLIQSAKKSIKISYFIFAEDATSLKLLALLRQKAREGVEVKVMIDALFNAIPKYMGTHLVKEGVQIKNFNKFSLFRLGHILKYRMHDKMMIIDDEEIILGGRNIEDTYYALSPAGGKKNYHDRDIYIEGEIAAEASAYYDRLWEAKHVSNFKKKKRLHKKRRARKLKSAIDELDKKLVEYEEHQYVKGSQPFEWLEGSHDTADVELAHDFVSYRKKRITGTAKKLYELIENAKHTVLIDSPYFILTKEMKRIFKDAIARGVTVRVLTNSLRATDGIVPQAAYIGQRRKIVKMGIELYEYYADDCFHSKSMVIDDEIAVIGSFNFDPRSQNLNTETAAIVRDKTTSDLLARSMEETLLTAQKIDKKGRPEGSKKRLPGVKFGKKLATRLLQWLIVPWTKPLL
jgi:putative cardiolipin synthase